MQNIATTVASKAIVAAVAAAMIFSAFAAPVKAQSVEDLQKMINDLMSQISALQGQGGTSGSVASGVCPFTWTRDLRTGMTGADVMKLQQFLNGNPDTRVAASGAGSVGAETQYFGPATAAAVSKFQVMHRADILTPSGLTNPTGFFGPTTRAKANALCVTPGTVDEDEDEEEEDEEGSSELSGEASLDLFEMEDGSEDEAEEGESDVVVGELSVEFTDGDASISRIDLTVSGPSNANAYDAFETIALWVDGDMVAEFDASDEDNYLDEDDGTIRFAGLDIVAMEDEELNIEVAVTVMNNVDSNEIGNWTITPNAVRYFDADGVATTENDGGSNPIVEGSAEFEIVEEGNDEALDVSLSSDSPDSKNLPVDADSDTNDVTIMVMTLEAENNDVDLNNIVVRVNTPSASTTRVVDEAKLVIDGQTFRAESLGTLANGRSQLVSAAGTSIWYTFDIDGDVVIDEDSEIEAELVIDFNDTNDGANYMTGQQINASVDSAELDEWDVEGANGFTPDGAAIGETHTLVDEGLTFDVASIKAVRVAGTGNTPVDTAEFEVEVEVTAIGDTFYLEDDAATAFDFTLLRNGVATTGVSVSPTLGGSGVPKNGNRYRIDDGQTQTFTFMVTVLPGGDASARYRVQFDDVDFFTASAGGSAITQTFIPSEDFRTNEVTIVN